MLEMQLIMGFISFIIILLFYYGMKFLITANDFKVGPQVLKISKVIAKDNSANKIKNESIDKVVQREKSEKTYINAANRMNITVPYKLYVRSLNSGIIELFLVLIASAGIMIMLSVFGILSPDTKLIYIISVPLIITSVYYMTLIKPNLAVLLKSKQATKDMNEEILLLLSIMKNSEEKNIRSIIETFLKSSKILKVDLQILLEDMKVFGNIEALTKFSDRLNNPLATQFIISVKSVLDSDITKRSTTLSLVEKDILSSISELRKREYSALIRQMVLVIIVIFVSSLLIAMGGMFAEVTSSLKEVM